MTKEQAEIGKQALEAFAIHFIKRDEREAFTKEEVLALILEAIDVLEKMK